MNGNSDDALHEEARLWAIRVRAPEFADWDGFTDWLEADPAHNRAYEAALDEMEDADALFDAPPAPQPAWSPGAPAVAAAPAAAPRTARWRVPAVAAGVAILAVGGSWIALDRDDPVVYATGPGERRSIDLADGSRVILNGGTRLTIDHGDPRAVVMAGGEALFVVRHDAANPFVVTTADGTRLVDIGTVFNVVAEDSALDVAVAEGAVIYEGKGGDMRLDAGEMLVRAPGSDRPVKRRVAPATIGAWRTGYLQFTDAPLSDVARQLSRNLGAPVAVSPELSERRFTGTVMLDGDAAAVMERVGPLAGVSVKPDGSGWRMAPPDGARR